jgi:hypothetical protein
MIMISAYGDADTVNTAQKRGLLTNSVDLAKLRRDIMRRDA